jgi:hypothetical protein
MESALRALQLQRAAVAGQTITADFIRDLERWEDDIELQDRQLRETATVLKVCSEH